MIGALNMELEIVRTVFRNPVCEASVYADTKGETGGHYTIVSIFDRAVCKEIAQRMALGGLFAQNQDFAGSFTHRDALNLVFAYHPESRLANKEAIYADSFVKRREIALSFLTALAETELTGDIGRLLITDDNINIAPQGKVYLNYYLDFQRFTLDSDPDDFYRDAARYAFDILSREYAAKCDEQVELYPNELRLMYKKLGNKAFKSFSQMMAFVRTLSDAPREQRFGAMRLLDLLERVRAFLLRKPANLFLAVVVLVTLGYLGYQLGSRAIDVRNRKENTVFVGLQTIGEIYLGEENV